MSKAHYDIVAACWTSGGDCAPLPGIEVSPVPLEERISASAEAGFTGFGIVAHDLRAYLAAGGSFSDLRHVLERHDVTTVELEFLVDWWLPDPERVESDEVLDLLLRAAGELGARDVKIGPDIDGGAFDIDRSAAGLHRVADAFARHGTMVAMEFMPFSNIPTLAAGLDVVRAADHPNAGLMVDIWHLVRAGDTVEDLAKVPIELVMGVELNDAPAEQVGSGYEDTVLRRRLCGEGDFPVVPFIETLVGMGWNGPWGLEIINEQYRTRPIREALRDAFDTTYAALEAALPNPTNQKDD
jgi:sugar phosphate isomerase/epimerase